MARTDNRGFYTPRWRGDERQRRTVFWSTMQHKDTGKARNNKTMFLTTLCLSNIFYLFGGALAVQASSLEVKRGNKKEHGEHWAEEILPSSPGRPPPPLSCHLRPPPPVGILCGDEERKVSYCRNDKNQKKIGLTRHTPAAISSKGKTYLASMGVVLLFLYSWKTIT